MNQKSTIVVFIGCLLILTNFSVVASAVTVSTSINKNIQNSVETIDPKSIKNEYVISPETYKVVPTLEEKSAPTLEENKVTTTQQSGEAILTKASPISVGYVVQPGTQVIPGGQQYLIAKSNANGPYYGQMDVPITFTGSSCYWMSSTTYTWDFGDNNDPSIGSGRHPTHIYSANGIYYVTLKVTKSSGESYLDIAPVYIGQQDNHLVPRGGCNYQGQLDEQINFDASNSISTDPSAYPLKYRWDFGDDEGYTSWSDSPLATHSYEKERIYQVKLEIKDSDGNTRFDVLHADVGCTFSSFRNLFLNTDGILDDVISLLYDNQGLGSLFCQWLQVKLYYKYNDNLGQTIQINNLDSQGYPIVVDVNNDGINDVSVGDINILSPRDGFRTSPFDPASTSMQFESGLSGIKILSGGCVDAEDDLTICVQFTFPPFFVAIYDVLGINLDPTVKIGVEFEAGKEKPAENEPISVTNYFRPYLIECLQRILTEQGNSEQYPNQQNQQVDLINSNVETNEYQYTTTYVQSYSGAVQELEQKTNLNVDSDDLQIDSQQQQIKPMVPEGVLNIYPENGITIDGTNGKSLSLLASVSTNTGYTIIFKTTFDSLFTPYIVTHRRAETLRDVDISGSDASAVTFSITAENSYGSATVGMTINPIQPLGLHLNIDRTNAERHATLNIDNPPADIVLFVETEDAAGEQAGHYFYMRNIPNSIELSWVPSLANGHIQITRDSGSADFQVGLCNDIKDPDTQFFFSNLPATMGLSWQISLEDTRSITLSSEIAGLTLNARLKDVTQPNQHIDFIATLENNLDLTIKWNPQEGYFALDRSETTVNFDFVISQEYSSLDIDGTYATGTGDGLRFTFNNFQNGIIELDSGKVLNVNVKAVNIATGTILTTGIIFEQSGHTKVNWSKDLDYLKIDSGNTIKFNNFDLVNKQFSISADEIKIQNIGSIELNWDQSSHLAIDTSSNLALTLSNFDISSEAFRVTSDEIKLAGSSAFYLSNEYETLKLSGENQITLNNLQANIRFWSGEIRYAKSVGNFDVTIKPTNKYYGLNMYNNLEIDNFNIEYDSPNDQLDTEFGVDAFYMQAGGSIWFNFSSATSKLGIIGANQLNLNNLHFRIGPVVSPTVAFSIPSFAINGVGGIYSEINHQHFLISADVAFNWDIVMQSFNYGNWQVNGTYSGSGTLNFTELQPGQSGKIIFSIPQNKAIHHSLKIIHDQLTLDLGSVDLNSGSATLSWKREQSPTKGYFNVTGNTITGTLALCKLTYNDPQNPFEFELGNVNVNPGNLYMDWQRQNQNDQKMFHINSGITINLALIKLKWDGKTITLGNLGVTPGEFKFTSDTQNKVITLNNGMAGFGPLCTYEDTDRKLSVDLLNLVNDYSKTMTLKWYQDTDNKIIGIYLDTDDSNLVDWVVFESIRYNPNGATGRRIALGGFQADDFKIMKNTNDKLEVSGHLYIANHLTYSKLVDLPTNEWEDLDIQWDLTSNLKWIAFESEFDVSIKLLSLDMFGIQFNSEFDLTDYLEVKWDLSGDSSQYKEFDFDTNGQVLSAVSFTILGPNNRGIKVVGGGVWAEDFYVKWKLWPPLQADIISGGAIGYQSAAVYGTIDGSTWIEIWPWASSPQ